MKVCHGQAEHAMAPRQQNGKDGDVSKKKRKSRALNKDGKERSKGMQLSSEDFDDILDWLEIGDNCSKIYGSQKNPPIGSKPKTKLQGLREMANWVNSQPRNAKSEPISAESMKNRWRFFFDKYKALKKETLQSGWGLDEDSAQLYGSIEEKIEATFPHYDRMDGLFGSNPSILAECKYVSMKGIEAADGKGDGKVHVESESDEEDEITTPPVSTPQVLADVLVPEELVGIALDIGHGIGMETGHGIGLEIGHGIGVETSHDNSSPDAALLEGTMGEMPDEGPTQSNLPNCDLPDGAPTLTHQSNEGRTSPNLQHGNGLPLHPSSGGRSPIEARANVHLQQKRRRRSASEASATNVVGNDLNPGDDAGGGHAFKQAEYPNKKQVMESRHSINSAFSESLAELNEVRVQTNNINKQKFEAEAAMRRERFEEDQRKTRWAQQFDETKLKNELLNAEVERSERAKDREEKRVDREERMVTSKQQFLVGILAAGQGRSAEELKSFLKEFGM